jgi:hypothetical protein
MSAPLSFPALWHAVRESDSTGNFHFNAGDERRGKCFLISAFLIDADQLTNKQTLLRGDTFLLIGMHGGRRCGGVSLPLCHYTEGI